MEEKRPKVLALYRAVVELLDEGADLNAMKVSDITGRAGIGKGTAYEYFKSKEELIACALLQDMEQNMIEERRVQEALETFAEKLEYSFQWIIVHFQEKKAFGRLLRLAMQPTEISKELHEELRRRRTDACTPYKVIGELCRQAKEKGEICENIPVSQAVALIMGSFMSFVLYLENADQMQDTSPDQMKRFLCGSLLEQLK
jgi:AcrR family transcriptional regulator